MLYSEPLRYNNIIPAGTTANATSIAVLAADSAVIEFTVQFNAAANYTLSAIISNQELPPDPTQTLSVTNEYSAAACKDLGTQTIYTTAALFNPSTAALAGTRTFQVQTNGARWFFLQLAGYTAGTLLKADADLFTGN